MYRTVMLFTALTLFAGPAAAQQPCTTDARQVVNELYRHMLERSPDAGSAHWVQQLESGQMTVRDVVREIAKSPEHMNRFHYTEAGESTPYERSVARLYRHILGRQPDAAGQRAHAELAQRDGAAAVADRIIDSREYTQQFGDWGVPGSGGVAYCGRSNVASSQSVNQGSSALPGRFRGMDTNNDGQISRSEWRGNARSFEVHDWNNDGMLSGDELDPRAARTKFPGNTSASPAATSGQLINVDSANRWTDTGITVRQGDLLTFDVSGSIQLSNDSNDIAGPAGARSGRRAAGAPLSNAPAGALIGRIGNRPAFAIGDQTSIRAPYGGPLFLGVNDDHLPDNSGHFRVMVDVQ